MERDNEIMKIEAMFDHAIELRDSGRLSEAVEKLNDILSMSPTRRAPILGTLGHIHFRMKTLDKALECYKEAVDLSPTSELASLGLFHTLWNMGLVWDAYAEAKRFLSMRDSEEYFRMIEEMREVFEAAGIELHTKQN